MKNSNLPKIDTKRVIERINHYLNISDSKERVFHDQDYFEFSLPRITQSIELQQKDYYEASELLKYHDGDFIKAAYQAILRRSPDEQGLHNFLSQLRMGRLSKLQILGRLISSDEAKRFKVEVNGIKASYLISKISGIPIIGYAIRLMGSLIKLPKILKNIQEFEAFSSARYSIQNEFVDNSLYLIEEEFIKMKNSISNFKRVEDDISALKNRLVEVVDTVNKLPNFEHLSKVEIEINKMREQISEVDNTVQALINVEVEQDIFDSLYLEFENKYRGTREDIKNRVGVYLPYVENTSSEKEDIRILDVGCGRGEWLELLKENGYSAVGVDINTQMINDCKALDLNAKESDVLAFMEEQPNHSYDVITGFHIIEHIQLNDMIKLFDESNRLLKPGGVMIFETPNPENILVGAYSFRFDPTHIHPLVPDTLQFIAEQRGFYKVEILRLHKRNEPEYTGQKYVDEIIYKVNMEQDFSIIAYKSK